MSDQEKELPLDDQKLKTYKINYKDSKESLTVKATSIAWTENGLFILLMEGETPKHVVVAGNVIAVTEA